MTDIAELEGDLTRAIAGAADERALDELRVAALGKKGSIAELLKTLGSMSPDERKTKGPLFNGLRDSIAAAIAARKKQLEDAALDARLHSERVDVTLPAPEIPRGTI
jgi:phenylalanyl-tRNA synthetase alpha chain